MLKIFRKKVAGEKRGRVIGFPTLNFRLRKGDRIKRGVWVVKMISGKQSYFGVANVGSAKTFGGREKKIEVYLLVRPTNNIKEAEIQFVKYLRPTKKFDTIGELKKQIKKDVELALCFLESLEKKEK